MNETRPLDEAPSGCDAWRGSILAAVEGLLTGPAREQFDAHVAVCPHCRRAVADQGDVKRLLADLPLADVSPGFAARVRERTAATSWFDLVNWRLWTLRLAPLAAVLALLAWASFGGRTTDVDSLATAIESWAMGDAAEAHVSTLLNPDIDGAALVAAELEALSR